MNGNMIGAAAQCGNTLAAVPDAGPTDAMMNRMVNVQSTTIDLLRDLEQRLDMVLVADDSKAAGEVSPGHATQLHNAIQGRIDTAEWINSKILSLLDRVSL